MRTCKNCGLNISHLRKNAEYCDTNCKDAYNNKIKKNRLSDNFQEYGNRQLPPIPDMTKYNPAKKYNNEISNTINSMANDTLGAVPIPNVVLNGVTSAFDYESDPNHSIWVFLGLLGGGTLGYFWNDINGVKGAKSKQNRGKHALFGLIVGVGGVEAVFALKNQRQNANMRKMIEQRQLEAERLRVENTLLLEQEKHETTLQGIREIKGVSGFEMMNEMPAGISYNGKFKDFLGSEFSYGVQMILYGSSSSGKSHLLAQFVSDFSERGSCLVILSEQGTNREARKIYQRYGCNEANTHFFDMTKSSDILYVLNNGNYDYLFLDSIDSVTDLTANEKANFLLNLKKHSNLKASFVVTHQTKEGKIRGSLESVYNADVSIEVKKGIATHAVEEGANRKNRSNWTVDRLKVFDDVNWDGDKIDGSDNFLNEAKKILNNLDRKPA